MQFPNFQSILTFMEESNHALMKFKCSRSTLKVVDGVVNLTGLLTLGSGEGLKYLETGRAQFYALIVFAGVIGLVVLFGVIGGPIA